MRVGCPTRERFYTNTDNSLFNSTSLYTHGEKWNQMEQRHTKSDGRCLGVEYNKMWREQEDAFILQ